MLSFKFVTNASGAAHYFESSDDYYGAEGHQGEWIGKGAVDLGLEGDKAIDRETFQNLLEGQLPGGQRMRLSVTKGSKDRKGIDFTFSAPKSVSIQALVRGDRRLVAAHDAAVRRSIERLQQFAAARKKQAGLSFREHTGNLVTATFRHELSRAQDPQLHTHAIVMNLTRRSDGEWRALSNEDMLKNVKMVGAFYRAELAMELRTLGFSLRETRRGGWELAHISDAAIRHFSQRSREIERLLAGRGQDRRSATTAQKQIITLASRPRKTESDRAWLRSHWLQTACDAGIDLDAQDRLLHRIVHETARAKDALHQKIVGKASNAAAADKAIDFAIAHLAERQGIFSRAELLEVAYGRAATLTSTEAVEAALDRAAVDGRLLPEVRLFQTARSLNISAGELAKDPSASRFKGHDDLERLTRSSWVALSMVVRKQSQAHAEASVDAAIQRGALVAAEARFATPEARRIELRILAMERAGRGSVAAVSSDGSVASMLNGGDLNAGQREAVSMMLTTHDRFVGIQGLAGTGKSHALSKAVAGIRAETCRQALGRGYRVVGLAPYASQNEALASLGMESQTLASFLARTSEQRRLDGHTIVFLDEAGVVPAHQLERLMTIVERQGARMILCGDRNQTHAVEAGKPFDQLQDAGMTKAFLTEIKRQKNEAIRAAVTHAASNRVPAAVAVLSHTVVEVKQDSRRHERIADAYALLGERERRETLIVAGTNEARRAINALVRERLSLPGGHAVAVLNGVDMTRAELGSAQSYEPGQIVVPQRTRGADFVKGAQLLVLGHDLARNRLSVQTETGRRFDFDPSRERMLRLYERDAIELAPGDWVRVSANDQARGLTNGQRFRVTDVDSAQLTLADGARTLRLDRDRPLPLQHGYASTIHSAQGITRDRVLVDACTRSLTSNRAVFYVAISRPRYEITLFTDDASKLAAAMSREPKKFAALELRDVGSEAAVLRRKVDTASRARLAATLRRGHASPGQLEVPTRATSRSL